MTYSRLHLYYRFGNHIISLGNDITSKYIDQNLYNGSCEASCILTNTNSHFEIIIHSTSLNACVYNKTQFSY